MKSTRRYMEGDTETEGGNGSTYGSDKDRGEPGNLITNRTNEVTRRR